MGLSTQENPHEVVVSVPRVQLVAFTKEPFNLAVASARTCYAADFVFAGRLDKRGERNRITLDDALPAFRNELAEIGHLGTPHERRLQLVAYLQAKTEDQPTRDAVAAFADLARQRAEADSRIAHSIYEAGHHTPFQHPTFVFALEGVSRNVVESFFHNHTFYNSEQQSQRYVEMKRAEVVVPASVGKDPRALALYNSAVAQAWDAYHDLRERLVVPNRKVMGAIGKIKGQSDKEVTKEAEKKSQEMARYVIPIAAATQLYHTVSGIVLLRYIRMCEANNTPGEARQVVEEMVEQVRRVDPAFIGQIEETTRPRGEQAEWTLLGPGGGGYPAIAHVAATGDRDGVAATSDLPRDRMAATTAFPRDRMSVLVHATPDAPKVVLAALREVTGSHLPDAELLRRTLDPGTNPVWNDTLNTWDHSPALRALRHVHYTFRKRLSLTAYAQDQRHRLTPGTRPLLQTCLTPKPDVHTPDIIAADPGTRRVYDAAIQKLWDAMLALVKMGIPAEDATYLLPNATNLTFHQSGDLLSFIHKWRLRLCFNAQKEIFDASLDELRQAQAVHPELTKWLGPPCTFVAAAQPAELQDSVEACCPEGPRWCGVKVWVNFDAAKGKPKRPY